MGFYVEQPSQYGTTARNLCLQFDNKLLLSIDEAQAECKYKIIPLQRHVKKRM